MSAFPRIDKTVGLQILDFVRGCTFDDFILSPQRSVLVRRDPVGDRFVVARVAPDHAQAADRVGQHGHRDAGADGDRPGGGRGHRHHRPRIPARRDRTAGARSRDREADAARNHPRSVEHFGRRSARRSGGADGADTGRDARGRGRIASADRAPDRARHAVCRPPGIARGRSHDPAGRARGPRRGDRA